MPKLHSGCLGYRRRRDSDIEDQYFASASRDDESTLVSRDEQDDGGSCFKPFTSNKNRSGTVNEATDERTDLTGSKQRRKQKRKTARKEMRKRVGHVMHSSWKWFKRGVVALSPAMASMMMFSPSPAVLIQATASARRDGGNNTSVFL